MNEIRVQDVHGTTVFRVEVRDGWLRVMVLRGMVVVRTMELDGWDGLSCTWGAFQSVANEACAGMI